LATDARATRSDTVVDQIGRGDLDLKSGSYDAARMETGRPRIKVVKDGPYLVEGDVPVFRTRPVIDAEGDRVEWERREDIDHDASFELCRCGRSTTMPFCDRVGEKEDFDGTETADRGPTMGRREQWGEGPFLVLTDDVSLCSSAAFCHRGDTDVWELAEKATDDATGRALLTDMVRRCPSGRLVLHRIPGGEADEEELAQSIGVIDNGPLWVRGGIPVEAGDGFEYEDRNRVTLCRCGQSRTKPFCDSSHVKTRFVDP
jgi:CDGSH-type Zn-finger protein